MRTISEQELKDILDKHGKWLRKEEGGERANLIHADLSHANLSHANLIHANLIHADLSHANLIHADLSHANLSHANLIHANLIHANLSHADLIHADLSHANLSHANLIHADLSHANLSHANLIIFQFQQSWAYFTFDGCLRIGCEYYPISEWQLMYKDIGKKHGYTDLQIEMYGAFINQCAEAFKAGKLQARNSGKG